MQRCNLKAGVLPMALCLGLLALWAALPAGAQENAATTGTSSGGSLPSFLGAMVATWLVWRAWLLSLSPYMVAVAGGLVAYLTGVVVFFVGFGLGSYAPTAARVGLWVFALLWFVVLAAVFIPLTAPWWWWPAALSVLLILLLVAVPRPRRAA